MLKLVIPAALSVAFLAACSPGISVDSKNATTVSNGESNDISHDSSSGRSIKAGRDIKMPVAGYINEVFSAIDVLNITAKNNPKASDPKWQGLLNAWRANPINFDMSKIDGFEYPGGQQQATVYMDWNQQLVDLKDKAIAGDKDAQGQIKYLSLLRVVGKFGAEAVYGWPSGGRESYAKQHAYFLHFANKLSTEIASKTPAKSLEDPSRARARVIEDLLAITPIQIHLMHEQSAREVKEEFSAGDTAPDDSTGRGTSWSTAGGANYYSGQSDGWTWTKNGVPWFGKGKLSGQDVSISLASSFDTSHQTKRAIGTKSGSTSDKQNSSSAAVR